MILAFFMIPPQIVKYGFPRKLGFKAFAIDIELAPSTF